MRRLAFGISIVCTFVAAILLTASISPYLPSTVDPLTLTVLYDSALATQVYMILGTPQHYLDVTQTASALAPARTEVALTRNPSLAVSPTIHPIRLTANQIVRETATAFSVDFAPATTPMPPSPVTPAPCQPSLWFDSPRELSDQMRISLLEQSIQVSQVSLSSSGVAQPEGCGTPIYPLNTQVTVVVEMQSINRFMNDEVLADLVTQILAVLTLRANARELASIEPPRLRLVFNVSYQTRIIETDYANALAAYNEGLRGEALLEALGGILPA